MKNKYCFLFSVLVFSLVVFPQISLADVLGVTGITAVRTSAMANNSYEDGWRWIFGVSVPANENNLQLKFTDWVGASTISTGGNVRYYSPQSLNSSTTDSAITITATDDYGNNSLILDPNKGQNVQVVVEIKVPTGTKGGAFSSSYGFKTTATTTEATSTPVIIDIPDGSLDVSSSSLVSTALTMHKGETAVVTGAHFEATSSAVSVNRLDAHFSVRPWLVFNQLTLKDGQGQILATKNLTSAADVTEITTGSDYMVRFDNLDYSVSTDTPADLVVAGSIPADNSFVGQVGYASTTVAIPDGAIRTVNLRGFTDLPTIPNISSVITLSGD